MNNYRSKGLSLMEHHMPDRMIDKKAVFVWRWEGIIASAVSLLIAAGLTFAAVHFSWSFRFLYFVYAAIALESLIMIVYVPVLKYESWRYAVTDTEIELQSGIWFVRRTSIPMSKVQHVDTGNGPIMRKYGLSYVTVNTAAGGHTIPALDTAQAESLRRRIAALAGVSDDEK